MKQIVAALLLNFAISGVHAESFSAKIIAVLDGDTVLILHNGAKVKVRLANIDAPEKLQSYGSQSRDSLLSLVAKKQVQVESKAVDQYGRVVATLRVDGLNVNEEQVKRGMAWEYSHYHSDRSFIAMQNNAQQARHGLWQESNPLPPWQWRKLHPLTGSALQVSPPSSLQHNKPAVLYDAICGHKKYCSQMSSCDEANFYLKRCGVMTLDRNKDGVPCEHLCR
jgi:endonuclease YncB( thermonuclease family)